ncbi:MAG TPA: TlyA family rRNA (cytidine-2'-O)-methyltransferase, partial [Firmicutes bacterium]|nr:TlyA family rRNA (cytidine-2'-O)-methyltransferase [Bacillota bacterium]
KLAKALDKFAIDLNGRIVLDVGASTGGFTDCCLQAGAKLVYAVDVGYGQLAWALRTNRKVINLERTNIRHLTSEQLTQGMPDFC